MGGRTALVVGATHGIGQGVLEYFVAAGARLMFSGRDVAAGSEFVATLSESGNPDVHFVAADLYDEETPARLVADAVAKLGGLDVLVNCAGIYPQIPLSEISLPSGIRSLA